MLLLISLLGPFFWPLLITGFVIFLIHNKTKSKPASKQENSIPVFTKENIVSQFFIILAVAFFGVTLGMFNKYIGTPLALYGVILTTLIVSIVVTYYSRLLSLGIITLLGFYLWWGNQGSIWLHDVEVKSVVLIVGFIILSLLLYALGHSHKKNDGLKNMSLVYFVFGIMSLSCLLLFFSTERGFHSLTDMMNGHSLFDSWQLTASLIIATLLLLGTLIYAYMKRLISVGEALAVIFIGALSISFLFISGKELYSIQTYNNAEYPNRLSSQGALLAIIINLALFLEILGLIFLGYMRQQTTWVNLGAFALFFLIFIKYIDWFWGSIDKSLFFIGAGVLLLFTGWIMEKGRKYMLSQMSEQTTSV